MRRSAETAEDSNQHTGKILGVVVAEKERREWSCSRVGGSYCLSFLLSADCLLVDGSIVRIERPDLRELV